MRTRMAGLVGAVALCVATGAVAGTRQSMTVELRSASTLNGKEIAPGTYKVSWTGAGPEVKVSFLRGKKLVVEAPGKFVERNSKAADDGLVCRKGESGPPLISEIRFGGENRVLVLAGS